MAGGELIPVGDVEADEEAAADSLALAAIAAMVGGMETWVIVCALPLLATTLGDASPVLFALFKNKFPVLTPLDGLKRAVVIMINKLVLK